MPTERFHRLPEEKKKAICDAAMKEFIRVPYDKASINRMIQSAEISRGSFYTYFEDKEDVLSFILQDARAKGKALAIEILKQNQGDIWITLKELLEQGILYCSNHDMYRLYRNIAIYPEAEEIIHREYDDGSNTEYGWVSDYIDASQFKNQSPETIGDIISVGMGILGESIGQFYMDDTRVEEVKKTFSRRLELLKHGACKEN